MVDVKIDIKVRDWGNRFGHHVGISDEHEGYILISNEEIKHLRDKLNEILERK